MPRRSGYTRGVLRRFTIPLVACALLGLLDVVHFGYYSYDHGAPIEPGRLLWRHGSPWIAWALYVAVALLWFVPDRRIERRL